MSGDEAMAQMLERLREAMRPGPRSSSSANVPPEFDKQSLVQRHQSMASSLRSLPQGIFMSGLNISRRGEPASVGAASSLAAYKLIMLKDMQLDHVHRGRVLYGTLVVEPFSISSVMTILEDGAGFAIPVSVCDQITEGDIPPGTKVAIKEPYLKFAADGRPAIRVDDSSRFVKVDDMAELVGLRLQGNAHFAAKAWSKAIEGYTLSIAGCLKLLGRAKVDQKLVHEVLLPALSNRAEAYIKLADFNHALMDANAALEIDPGHIKSTYRKGRALQGMQDNANALVWLQRVVDMDPRYAAEVADDIAKLKEVPSKETAAAL